MGTVEIKEWTMKDPLNCIGFNAGICWGSDISSPEKNIKRAVNCIKDGHGRVEELPDVYLVLDGWSAKCLRELYTHIGGSPTRMQASTRYIDYSKNENFKVVTPTTVSLSEEAAAVWSHVLDEIHSGMEKLKELGVPKEDYTNLLPLAYESKMIWKVNLRTLINFMNMRLCSRAYWEIRILAHKIKMALEGYSGEWRIIAHDLFLPKCESVGYCSEKHGCGRKPSKNEVIG